ncbi:hypothetical protein INT46_006163, partial [Mucor plumbeus]
MTAYQIPTENEQIIQWSNISSTAIELQQQPQDYSKKRIRTLDQDESDSSLTPPEKTIRLHESISNESVKHEQNNGKFIDISKLSTSEILSAYKRIWDNLDLSKPTDAKLEPFVWHKIRQYQQK